ncbi:porin [Rhizobiales bacterium]|uniref:porin n=1 Tax=Hongsoonwoonella zoysiae TaxID=2821844 RepID=UPI001561587F|nr:porin [Hongsoonwoonella zoysiae]NRG18102.1 porin [Hongsoonwoonella zoysiae]
MNIKSILLGAAAAAAAASGAQAADLPAAPEPVDYVRVCDAYGSGFFYMPGTETCLKVGGRLRTEFRFRNFADDAPRNRLGDQTVLNGTGFQTNDQNSTQLRARGYIRVDARTQTEYGLLRTYVSLHNQVETGTSGTTPTLEYGFVQFGGLTAGRAISMFEFFTGYTFAIPQSWGGTDIFTTNLFAYTQSFGNGFSATISVEDGLQNRGNIAVATNTALQYTTTGAGRIGDSYGGHRLPDFVANLRVDQGWGSAQLMGVLHQVWNDEASSAAFGTESELGWGIAGGVLINTPFIAPGDQIAFQVGYGEGASGYIVSGVPNLTDGVIDASGDIELTEAFSIGGGFTHNWTSHWSTNFNVNYTDIDVSEGNNLDLETTSVQGNLVWSPASGFLIGAELNYTYRDWGGNAIEDSDQLTAAIRVQRTF